MDLTELQLQLRAIENQMAVLQDEIEKMKPQTEDVKMEAMLLHLKLVHLMRSVRNLFVI